MYIYTGAPKLSDLPDDLRWSLCNNINKVHNESNVLEPNQNYPLPLVCGKLSSMKLVSGSRKIGHHCIYRLLYQSFMGKIDPPITIDTHAERKRNIKTTVKWSSNHKGREQIGWNEKRPTKTSTKQLRKWQ